MVLHWWSGCVLSQEEIREIEEKEEETQEYAQAAVVIKSPPARARDAGDALWSLGEEDLLEQEMATCSSIRVLKTAWTGEPGWLQSMDLQSWIQLSTHTLVI